MYIIKIVAESYGRLHDPRPPWDRIEILSYEAHGLDSIYDDQYMGVDQYAFPTARQATRALREMLWKEFRGALFSYFENIEHVGVPVKPEYFNVLFKHITKEDKEKLRKHGLHPVSGFKVTRTSLKEYLNRVMLDDKRGNFRYANGIRPVTYFLVFRTNSRYYMTKDRSRVGRHRLFYDRFEDLKTPPWGRSVHKDDDPTELTAKYIIALVGMDTILKDEFGYSLNLVKKVKLLNVFYMHTLDPEIHDLLVRYADSGRGLEYVLEHVSYMALEWVRNYLKKKGIIPPDYQVPRD
ncbi:MAG: hypothetical protein ACP5G5_07490 [Thermoplasmata archaeon]